jgi:hypothetical protein
MRINMAKWIYLLLLAPYHSLDTITVIKRLNIVRLFVFVPRVQA